MGIHFNVSAYAPFDVVARLFYSFMLNGTLWDESSGDMEIILPTIRWIVSSSHWRNIGIYLKLQIFVELGQTRDDDTLVHNRSTDVDVIQAIPLLHHLTALTTEFLQMPYTLTVDILTVLTFYDAYIAKKLTGRNAFAQVVNLKVKLHYFTLR